MPVLVEITFDMNSQIPSSGEIKPNSNKKTASKSATSRRKNNKTTNKVKNESKKNIILPRNGVDVINKSKQNKKLDKPLKNYENDKTQVIAKNSNEKKENNTGTAIVAKITRPISTANNSFDEDAAAEQAKQFMIMIDAGNDGQVGFLKMSPKVSSENAAIREPIVPIKCELPRPKDKPIKAAAKIKKATETKSNAKKSKTVQSHHITEYYPIRRSSRKTKSEVKKEIEEDMIEAVLNNREDGLEIKEFTDKGRGIVATRSFRKSAFIVEYAGDLISWQEAKERESEYAKDSNIGCYMYYFNTDGVNYCIDATSESGRKGRLLNHSRKNPNCKTKLIKIPNDTGKLLPKLVLIAAQDIQCGEELTYDYGDRDKASLDVHPWLKA